MKTQLVLDKFMSFRTWLKDAKHLGDLHSYFVEPKRVNTGEEFDTYLHLSLTRANRENSPFNLEVPLPPSDAQYFGSNMRDSYIRGAYKNSNNYALDFNDFRANWFAITLSKNLEIEMPKTIWLVTLHLTDAQYVRWAKPDRKGNLRFLRPEFEEETPFIPDYLKTDWFVQQNGRFQWIMVSKMEKVLVVDCAGAFDIEDR